MNLLVNSRPMELDGIDTLSDVISRFGASGTFAVALNGAFVSKQNYGETRVKADDKVEILSPIQGG